MKEPDANLIFKTLGASNHTEVERADYDFYATYPPAVKALLQKEKFNKKIWEPAAGNGHISEVLKEFGYKVFSSDLLQREYPLEAVADFLKLDKPLLEGTFDIIGNPPYNSASDFILKSLELLPEGGRLCYLLKLLFLEGGKRYQSLFKEHPPKLIYVFSTRIPCARNGIFNEEGRGKAVAYAWFIWEKGYKGEPIIRWISEMEEK